MFDVHDDMTADSIGQAGELMGQRGALVCVQGCRPCFDDTTPYCCVRRWGDRSCLHQRDRYPIR